MHCWGRGGRHLTVLPWCHPLRSIAHGWPPLRPLSMVVQPVLHPPRSLPIWSMTLDGMLSGKKENEKEKTKGENNPPPHKKPGSSEVPQPAGGWRAGGRRVVGWCRTLLKFLLMPDKRSNTGCVIAAYIKGAWGLLLHQLFCNYTSSQ